MSTARSGKCKKCQRKSVTPAGPPSILINHMNGSLGFESFLIENAVMSNFDGDLAPHCAEAVIQKIKEDIEEAIREWANDPETSEYLCFDSQKPNPPCYEVRLSKEYKVTAKCTCNKKDISEGKGPPKAEVTSNGMSIVASPYAAPCNPPPDVPPTWADVPLSC